MTKRELIYEALWTAFGVYNNGDDEAEKKAVRLAEIINDWDFQEMLEELYGDR